MINLVSDSLARRLPFFYGYVMIPVAMAVQICTSPGQTFAMSAFTPALRASLALSDSQLSLAYMLGTLAAAVPLSLVGPLSDRFGLRVVTLLSVIGLASACWYASHVTGFFTLLLAFFLLRFLGQGSLSLLSGNTISMWFRSRIGRVSAIMSIGMSIAFAWVPQWLSESIAADGWRFTYQAIAVIVFVTMLPVVLLLFRNRPEDLGQAVDGVWVATPTSTSTAAEADVSLPPQTPIIEHSLSLDQALRSRSIYLLGATMFLWAMAGTGFVFYMFDICAERDQAPEVAGNLFKTFGLTMLVMQLVGGVLADFLPLHRMLGIGTVMLAAGTGFLWQAQDQTALHAFAGLFGGGQGLLIAVNSVVWVRYYGRNHLGSIRGAVWSLTVAGSGCGPLLMGVVRDRSGIFDGAIGCFFVSMLLLAVGAWWATPPRPPVTEIEPS